MSEVVGILHVKKLELHTSVDQLQLMGYGKHQMLQWWEHV